MTECQMSGRGTHATRIPFHPELVSLRVLLQSPSARHNVRYFPFRVGKLLEPRTQLQSLVLRLYYLTRKDDRHVRVMSEAGQVMANSAEVSSESAVLSPRYKLSSAPPLYATTLLYPNHAMSIQTALTTEFPELSHLTCISCRCLVQDSLSLRKYI
jgi:hypothetical protein